MPVALHPIMFKATVPGKANAKPFATATTLQGMIDLVNHEITVNHVCRAIASFAR